MVVTAPPTCAPAKTCSPKTMPKADTAASSTYSRLTLPSQSWRMEEWGERRGMPVCRSKDRAECRIAPNDPGCLENFNDGGSLAPTRARPWQRLSSHSARFQNLDAAAVAIRASGCVKVHAQLRTKYVR